jgi:hypothetical protein
MDFITLLNAFVFLEWSDDQLRRWARGSAWNPSGMISLRNVWQNFKRVFDMEINACSTYPSILLVTLSPVEFLEWNDQWRYSKVCPLPQWIKLHATNHEDTDKMKIR